MSRTLFIGDSHTMGYHSDLNKYGAGSFSQWNDNNYAEIYSELNDKPVIIYALSGASNRLYTDWLKSMFEKYDDIDEVFISLAAFNRFIIAFDDLNNEPIAGFFNTLPRFCVLTSFSSIVDVHTL